MHAQTVCARPSPPPILEGLGTRLRHAITATVDTYLIKTLTVETSSPHPQAKDILNIDIRESPFVGSAYCQLSSDSSSDRHFQLVGLLSLL